MEDHEFDLTLRLRLPRIQLGRITRRLLPTFGNAIFTLAMIGLLIAAQSAGALSFNRPQAAPAVASTGTIAYQGRLADAAGAPLTGTYSMIFHLYDAASGGAPLWSEQWTGSNGVKVSDGLFNIMLGSLTALPQSIIAGHDQLFLGITVGEDDEMAPRVQLGSVPFAVQALTVPDGSVSTAKIADGAVTATKITDGAITQAKAPLLLQGQGTGYRVLSGRVATHPLGGADIWFTPPFSEPPVVIGIAQDFAVQLYDQPAIDHAAFTIHSATEGVIIHWIAIGR